MSTISAALWSESRCRTRTSTTYEVNFCKLALATSVVNHVTVVPLQQQLGTKAIYALIKLCRHQMEGQNHFHKTIHKLLTATTEFTQLLRIRPSQLLAKGMIDQEVSRIRFAESSYLWAIHICIPVV